MTDLAWLGLSLTDRIGLKTLRALLAHFGNANAVLAASEAELREVSGVGKVLASSIRQINLLQVEALMLRWKQAGVKILLPDDYPAPLRELDDAPAVMFVRGELSQMRSQMRGAAIVGTREPTALALEVARKLSVTLAEQNTTIVSGLALGIDAAAHQSALEVGGVCVAVLGSGVLNIYPQENRSLALQVAWVGAMLSEVRPDAQPSASALVARNRIITGLSERVFVIETDADGGAMHAARFARVQGRDVYALDIAASGNRALLESGALPFDMHLNGI
jgi:DNA processing protein